MPLVESKAQCFGIRWVWHSLDCLFLGQF